jgi:hypothetical protein
MNKVLKHKSITMPDHYKNKTRTNYEIEKDKTAHQWLVEHNLIRFHEIQLAVMRNDEVSAEDIKWLSLRWDYIRYVKDSYFSRMNISFYDVSR